MRDSGTCYITARPGEKKPHIGKAEKKALYVEMISFPHNFILIEARIAT